MNRAIPHYQITENNKDFPNWGVKILSGDFANVEYVIDKLGVPENVNDNDTPISVKIEYTLLAGEVEEDQRLRFTQTVGWILEDIIE
jgi:hypothetical protein